ncbi:hypothetical protein AX289_31355 [Methylorubrum populi]|nr:hypothetical protein AX289_31355 [Methylorubrum populi]
MNLFEMVSGIGNSFSKSYDAAKKDALTSELGEKIRTGDFTGAADVALRGGDLKTGLELVKLGETRGASKQLGETLGGLFGGGGEAAPAEPSAAGDFGSNLSRSYRQGGTLPTFAQGSDIGRYASAIQSNESGGRYDIVGPTHKKYGRALGAYQVMESNLPSWSKEAIGREVSPDEFLRSPQIQDAIFQTKFGQAVAKYGNPEDAASVWFTGRPLAQGANAKDVLGTTGAEYVRRFNSALGRAPAGAAPSLPATAMRMPSAPEGAPQIAVAGTDPQLPQIASPQRSSVAVANNEADVQALERGMGMLPGAPRQVASAEPDAANLPAQGALNAGFQIPEGQSQEAAAPLGLPPRLQTAGALAQARLPTGTAGPILRAAPGSPQRVQALIRASLIPGLSEQQLSTVRTLLASEIEQSKLTGDQRDYALAQSQGFGGTFIDFKNALSGQRDEGAKINLQVTAREREVRDRGLDPNEPANRRYILTGSMPEAREPQDEGAKITSQIAAREVEARRLGLEPGTPKFESYVLTNKIGRDQELSATDKKAIMEAEESVLSAQTAIEALNQAKAISPKAYFGPTAGVRGYATSLIGSEAGEATQEMENIVSTNALWQLKAIFGGNPTEGERKILLQIQGSASQPDEVRQKIFDRGIALAQRRLEFNQRRADDLKGGTFYKPDGKAAERGATDATSSKALPKGEARTALPAGYSSDRVLFEARAAVRAGKDPAAIGDWLRARGIDPKRLED